MKTKPRSGKRVVKAWAVGDKESLFEVMCAEEKTIGNKRIPVPEASISVFSHKSDAKIFAKLFQDGWEYQVLILPCTISYTLPTPKSK